MLFYHLVGYGNIVHVNLCPDIIHSEADTRQCCVSKAHERIVNQRVFLDPVCFDAKKRQFFRKCGRMFDRIKRTLFVLICDEPRVAPVSSDVLRLPS